VGRVVGAEAMVCVCLCVVPALLGVCRQCEAGREVQACMREAGRETPRGTIRGRGEGGEGRADRDNVCVRHVCVCVYVCVCVWRKEGWTRHIVGTHTHAARHTQAAASKTNEEQEGGKSVRGKKESEGGKKNKRRRGVFSRGNSVL
jgi:hypothetical protein